MSNIKNDSDKALEVITSIIKRCEKAQLKFNAGTSQHTLLKNRLNALHISRALLSQQDITHITKSELTDALAPITSIINKCEKAQQKYNEDNANYKRYVPILDSMKLCKLLISDELKKHQENV